MQNRQQGATDGHGGGFLADTFTPAQMSNLAKNYVEPGKTIFDLFLRTSLVNERLETAIVKHYARILKFDPRCESREYQILFAKLASLPSIKGERIDQLTEMFSGHFRGEASRGGVVGKFKNWAFGHNENQED